MNRTKKITITALLVAMGIVLPMAFHMIPNSGKIFLPMHIPVLLCGFITGPIYGLLCGIITPIISSFATGMPPVAMLPAMVVELALYGFASGILYRVVKTKYKPLNIYISLIVAMLIGRFASGFINGVIMSPGVYGIKAWISASFVVALPGIAIQIVLIPVLLYALDRARLVMVDYRDVWGLGTARHTKESKEFFNKLAKDWDKKSEITEDRLRELISKCKVQNGDKVLDIACGTGIIDNELVTAGASSVKGVDIAENMIEIAKAKNKNANVEYEVEDFYNYIGTGFDKAIVFNAFPHFVDRQSFAKRMANCLKKDGIFIIMHSESAEKINRRHSGGAKKVSKALCPAIEEMVAFEPYFKIIETIDNDSMYMIVGQKL